MRRSIIPLLLSLACTLACGGSDDDTTTSLDGVDVAAASTAAAAHGGTPTDQAAVKA